MVTSKYGDGINMLRKMRVGDVREWPADMHELGAYTAARKLGYRIRCLNIRGGFVVFRFA